ncbi:MAG TPA: glucans biosynthesis glucosyltransferase MdoH [Alphaproteobacteria bacterium]|nr:glucans biosynthesis glucosyltransferase MdoH [Alphaproteobacteria bacterium]
MSLPEVDEEARALAVRRTVVVFLTLASLTGLGLAMGRVMAANGWSPPAILFLTLFLLSLPWTLLGFWNSVLGFVILRLVRDPVAFTNPALRATPEDSPIVASTAVCVAVRHEDVPTVFARLETMIQGILASGWATQFAFHVLSDSARPEVARAEEEAFAVLRARYCEPGFVNYRRREANIGFKAGNLHEFAERAIGRYDHMIVLDADSLMSAAAMLRLVRAMQANPRLGILQSLVVGHPSESAFTRIFQFGMRQSMRTQTVGSAWWQGPAGPYWGHNAIIRLQPFVAHCRLPVLAGKPPLGGHVLSHDQVEAAMMRAAGWDVRVIPDERESWEENPPSLPDFIKRDLRWCQGNMQYVKLFGLALKPMGRFQLINAIAMYLGAPFGVAMLAAGLAMAFWKGAQGPFPAHLAFELYFVMMAVGFAPRILGALDILLKGEARLYGGAARLIIGSLIDTLFSILLGPIMMVAQARFVVGLLFGKRVIWEAQNREGRQISYGEALKGLWPQLVFGAFLAAALVWIAPGALAWAAPTILPAVLAIPFARLSAGAVLGRFMARHGICAIPDEYARSATLARLAELRGADIAAPEEPVELAADTALVEGAE